MIATAEVKAKPGKYVTFRLARETYAIGVLHVREIIVMTPITQVPNMPSFVKGVINLRGRIIPVIDLRAKFGLGATEYRRETCIIVVDLYTAKDVLAVGVMVDAVCHVVLVQADSIEPAPTFGKVDTTFLLGMSRTEKDVRLLLDIEKVLNDDETTALSGARSAHHTADAAQR